MAPKYRQQLQKAKRDLREQHDGEPPTQEVRELTRARLKEARTEAKATKRIQEREKTEQRLANEEKMDEAEFLLQEIKNLPEP